MGMDQKGELIELQSRDSRFSTCQSVTMDHLLQNLPSCMLTLRFLHAIPSESHGGEILGSCLLNMHFWWSLGVTSLEATVLVHPLIDENQAQGHTEQQ